MVCRLESARIWVVMWGWAFLGFLSLLAGWASGTGEPGLAGRRALRELGSDGRLGTAVIPRQRSHLQGRV